MLVVLLGTLAYALAEDLTLTTYYPSPRGVYKELRASGDVAIGTTAAPQARLQVVRATDATSLALLVEDAPNDPTPFVLDETGKLGLGTRDPTGPLTITGAMTDPVSGNCPAGYDWYNEDGDGTIDPQECRQTTLIIQATGRVGIGTSAPAEMLEVNGNIKLSGATPTYAITNVATPTGASPGSNVATKDYVDAAGGGGVCYTNYGENTCNAGAGFTAALTGYTTVYIGGLSGSNPVMSGGLACSSVAHQGPEGAFFYATSYSNQYSMVRSEPCAICCK